MSSYVSGPSWNGCACLCVCVCFNRVPLNHGVIQCVCPMLIYFGRQEWGVSVQVQGLRALMHKHCGQHCKTGRHSKTDLCSFLAHTRTKSHPFSSLYNPKKHLSGTPKIDQDRLFRLLATFQTTFPQSSLITRDFASECSNVFGPVPPEQVQCH